MDEKEKEYLLVKLNEAIENKTRYRVNSEYWANLKQRQKEWRETHKKD